MFNIESRNIFGNLYIKVNIRKYLNLKKKKDHI